MKAYILTFLISLFLCFFSDMYFNNKQYRKSKFFLFLAMFTLCLIAAFRDEYVGRDIHNYLTLLFRDFSNGVSLLEEMKSTRASGIEPLFMLLVLFASKFNNLNIVFFFVQLAIVLPVFIFAYKNKKIKNVPITFTIFIFLMSMYAYSFSMMRQSISICICLLSLFYYMNDKKIKSYFLLIIAFLFHRTSVILVSIYLLYNFIFKNKKNRFLYLFITIIMCFIVGLILPKFVSLLPAKYSMYLGSNYETSFNLFSLMKKMFFLILSFFLLKGNMNIESLDYKMILFSIFLVIFDIAFYIFGLQVPEISRLCLYFTNIFYFIFLPILITKVKPRCIGYGSVVLLLFFFWFHMTTGNNEADIYPYRSDLIPFLND